MAGKIYILSPYKVVTGGCELLHQLCYKLNLLGYDSSIYYMTNETGELYIPKEYQKYNVKTTNNIVDLTDNVIIFPEVYIGYLSHFQKSKKMVWWLSVDNAHASDSEYDYMWQQQDIIHLSQSEYSTQMLKSKGIPDNRIFWLSDYINSEFLHITKEKERENIILFNPIKGYDMTSKIIRKSRGYVKWVALSGFAPEELKEVFQMAKLYIDFGTHPGRDRIPREATICGCCLITNREGSAANDVDILIDNKYKFDNDADLDEIWNAIYNILIHYEEEKANFVNYCNRTAGEFGDFEKDLLSVFEHCMYVITDIEDKDGLIKRMQSYLECEEYERAYQCLIKYHKNNYPFDDLISILEGNIRLGIGELNEAEYVSKRGLKSNPNNYELTLLLAQIHLAMGRIDDLKDTLNECVKAIELARGTKDEDIITTIAEEYIQEVKRQISK